MGRHEFDLWSERILSGSLVAADVDAQKFALANMLLHLGPTESHKPDAFFIHSLRKFAVNETAVAIRDELYAKKKAREEASKVQEPKDDLLENAALQGAPEAVVPEAGVQGV